MNGYRTRAALDAYRILKQEREQRNPWAHVAEEEREMAAAFADKVVGWVCILLAGWILGSYFSPDIAAWIHGGPAVTVSK